MALREAIVAARTELQKAGTAQEPDERQSARGVNCDKVLIKCVKFFHFLTH